MHVCVCVLCLLCLLHEETVVDLVLLQRLNSLTCVHVCACVCCMYCVCCMRSLWLIWYFYSGSAASIYKRGGCGRRRRCGASKCNRWKHKQQVDNFIHRFLRAFITMYTNNTHFNSQTRWLCAASHFNSQTRWLCAASRLL